MPSLIAPGGHRKELEAERYLVGSDSSSDITLRAGLGIAPRHYVISRKGNRWLVEPLAAGTLLNGKAIESTTPVTHGDDITVGQLTLRFDDPAALADADAHPKGLAAAIDRAKAAEAAREANAPMRRRLRIAAIGLVAVLIAGGAFAIWKKRKHDLAQRSLRPAQPAPAERQVEPPIDLSDQKPVSSVRTDELGNTIKGVELAGEFYDSAPNLQDPRANSMIRITRAENTRAQLQLEYLNWKGGDEHRDGLRQRLNLATAESLQIAVEAFGMRNGLYPQSLSRATAYLSGTPTAYVSEDGSLKEWLFFPDSYLSEDDLIAIAAPEPSADERIVVFNDSEPDTVSDEEAISEIERVENTTVMPAEKEVASSTPEPDVPTSPSPSAQ